MHSHHEWSFLRTVLWGASHSVCKFYHTFLHQVCHLWLNLLVFLYSNCCGGCRMGLVPLRREMEYWITSICPALFFSRLKTSWYVVSKLASLENCFSASQSSLACSNRECTWAAHLATCFGQAPVAHSEPAHQPPQSDSPSLVDRCLLIMVSASRSCGLVLRFIHHTTILHLALSRSNMALLVQRFLRLKVQSTDHFYISVQR